MCSKSFFLYTWILLFTLPSSTVISQPVSPSVSFTSTPTPTTTLTITATPAHWPGYVCPDCPIYRFDVFDDYQYWQVPLTATYKYIAIALWGAGGTVPLNSPSYKRRFHSTYGAFVTGVLPVTAGENLRIIVGASGATENDYHGCGSRYLNQENTGKGGGRSALQRVIQELPSQVFADVVTAGGGGAIILEAGMISFPPSCDDPGHGSSINQGLSTSTIGGHSDEQYSTTCLNGNRNCGNLGGGGGYCGGTSVAPAQFSSWNNPPRCAGGGTSYPKNLLCGYVADMYFGNLSSVRLPIVGSPGTPEHDGAVYIWILPDDWKPCEPGIVILPSNSASASATATGSAQSTKSKTTTATASSTASSSATSTASSTSSSTKSSTASATGSATSTSSGTATSSIIPSNIPSASPSVSYPYALAILQIMNINPSSNTLTIVHDVEDAVHTVLSTTYTKSVQIISICDHTNHSNCVYTVNQTAKRLLLAANENRKLQPLSNNYDFFMKIAYTSLIIETILQHPNSNFYNQLSSTLMVKNSIYNSITIVSLNSTILVSYLDNQLINNEVLALLSFTDMYTYIGIAIGGTSVLWLCCGMIFVYWCIIKKYKTKIKPDTNHNETIMKTIILSPPNTGVVPGGMNYPSGNGGSTTTTATTVTNIVDPTVTLMDATERANYLKNKRWAYSLQSTEII